jgi:hypothetical protein
MEFRIPWWYVQINNVYKNKNKYDYFFFQGSRGGYSRSNDDDDDSGARGG